MGLGWMECLCLLCVSEYMEDGGGKEEKERKKREKKEGDDNVCVFV